MPMSLPLAINPRLPAVVRSVAVSAGKVSSDVHAGNFCVNPSWWIHLFPNQNTGRFLMLGPNLLNSCILRQIISIFQLDTLSLTLSGWLKVLWIEATTHLLCRRPGQPPSCLPLGFNPWRMQVGTLPKKKKGRILFFSSCVCQGGGDGQ